MRKRHGEALSDAGARVGTRLGPVLAAAALLAAVAVITVPRAFDAGALVAADDPAAIAEQALAEKFDPDTARRGIEAALAAKDADLAASFVDLAAARHVTLDPALTRRVNAAVADADSTAHAAENFARGLVTGVPEDTAGFAGTALGDLFVFGDIRDALREGARFAAGEEADELVLGLACVGIAITAGTYVTFGAGVPVRAGLSIAKAARKAGHLGGELAAVIGRALRRTVDWGQLKRAFASASVTEPALAVRAARDAVKLERAGGLVHFARDLGRVQAKAGTLAARDALKIAGSPRDMGRIARLAEKEGGRTRAILKVLGRGAITLSALAFDLASWIASALFAVLAFVATLKSATERATLRALRRRKARRRKAELRV